MVGGVVLCKFVLALLRNEMSRSADYLVSYRKRHNISLCLCCGDAMKLTDEQRQRIANAMKDCIDDVGYCDWRVLAAGMRELAKIHDYIAQDGWSCDASTALILTLVADDLEAK
jgi:hypothetical protein